MSPLDTARDQTSPAQKSHCVNTIEEGTGQKSHCVNTIEEGTGQKSHCVNTVDDTQHEGQLRTCTHPVSRLTVGAKTKAPSTWGHDVSKMHIETVLQKLVSRLARSHSQLTRHSWREPPIGMCCLQVDVFQSFLVSTRLMDHEQIYHVPPVAICSTIAPNAGS